MRAHARKWITQWNTIHLKISGRREHDLSARAEDDYRAGLISARITPGGFTISGAMTNWGSRELDRSCVSQRPLSPECATEEARCGAINRLSLRDKPESGSEMTGRTKRVACYATSRNTPAVSTEEERQAKAFALECIANVVEGGLALLVHTTDGASELRLVTGQVYRLGEKTMRQIA
jgi:hypothetical protein